MLSPFQIYIQVADSSHLEKVVDNVICIPNQDCISYYIHT